MDMQQYVSNFSWLIFQVIFSNVISKYEPIVIARFATEIAVSTGGSSSLEGDITIRNLPSMAQLTNGINTSAG